MTENNEALVELIRAEIDRDGPIPFARFMEHALYHPAHGYYSSGRAKIGRHGDYFTNVSVGPIFGGLLAAQFDEIWRQLGKPLGFVIVEQGADSGEFARDVLQTLETRSRDFFDQVRYRIIEPFPILRDRQSRTLSGFLGKVDWRVSLEELEPFTGIQFSNEFLDATPVHLVSATGGSKKSADPSGERSQWMERAVDWRNGEFALNNRPISGRTLQERANKLPLRPTGYKTEVNLAALKWIHGISEKLIQGVVLTIDYGYPREEFYAEDRTAGTLECRMAHRIVSSPLEKIGSCDITAHVEWTSIAEKAMERGLRLGGFTDQHHFLTGILSAWPELGERADGKTRRALQTLLHPEMLGRNFQVLALTKDGGSALNLSGLKYARDSEAVLGL